MQTSNHGRSSKFYETDSFKKEQDEWYEKLKQEGFHDLEHNEYLSTASAPDSRAIRRGQQSQATEYYRKASEFLWSYKWKNKWPGKFDRFVWEQHTKGKSLRQIAVTLAGHKTKKWRRKKDYINTSLKRSKLAMKQE